MKRNLIHILLFLFTGLALFSACDDENFSTDSSLNLDLSYDTLRMDTVLAGIGNST